jgi:hypothetical protein
MACLHLEFNVKVAPKIEQLSPIVYAKSPIK